MKKVLSGFVLLAMVMVFSSCIKETVDLTECTDIYFPESKVSVNRDSEVDVRVCLEPEGTEEYNNVSFRLVNEKIAEVVYTDELLCHVKGKKVGATVMVASCNGLETKCIVNVVEPQEGGARSINSSMDDECYMYTVTYRCESGYAVMCFIKERADDFSVEDGKLYVVRDNGVSFSVPMNDLLDFGIEMIE